jgi:hypothetical protein
MPHVDREHIFHRRYKGAVGLRRDDPALPAMRTESLKGGARTKRRELDTQQRRAATAALFDSGLRPAHVDQ